jgi:catechol 2,3-dioxygenase-like lactoylglutathione lyase family enzyme
MVRNFDHVTIVVRDVEAAKRFFAFLGFKEVKSVVISGKVMEDYMGVKGIEAEHVTLAIENLPYRKPEMIVDADVLKPNKLGFNHICFAVDDLEDREADRRRHAPAQQDDGIFTAASSSSARKISQSNLPSGIALSRASVTHTHYR